MRRIHLGAVGVSCVLQLTACAVSQSNNDLSDKLLMDRAPQDLRAYNISTLDRTAEGEAIVQMEGWIIQPGEFRLYSRRENMGLESPHVCVSGMFEDASARGHAQSLQGRHVRIRGRLVLARYLDRLPPGALSPVSNLCDGDFLLYGMSIEAVND